ncbi:MAG TPA: CRTAC1 family protein [Candidatus Paceibacterota bacterium]|nr:CRTAC1 family protein [Candidatus Paceibacterota bacterium]HSA00976.1 CRTAC1 family protein [Candidatus Paceibacterota bacterium]
MPNKFPIAALLLLTACEPGPKIPNPANEIPVAPFTDITASAGIQFVHVNGAFGDKLLPETMGGGVAFLDYDRDGHQDLLFVNSSYWPDHPPPDAPAPTLALYRNDGHGRFTEVTAGSGLDIPFYGMGVAIGDYDNDGLPDVFITAVGHNRLFHNEDQGKFREVAHPAGVAGSPVGWSTGAAWIDYDNDGLLDLFVSNYVNWSADSDRAASYELPKIGRAYGPPRNFHGTFPYLYHNEGNGRFRDVSASAGIQIKDPATGFPMAKSLAIAAVDVDNDGWIDIVVANDTVPNFLFHNQHDGTFKEIGAFSGVAYDAYGLVRGAMGIDSARFRNDDALGIAIGNFANEMNALYVAQRDSLLFADEAIKEGVGPASQKLLKFGLFFFDYDLDGRLDVLTANGHLEPEIDRMDPDQHYRQPAQLFWNRGDKKGLGFVPVPPEKCGQDLFQPIVGRGSAFADIDSDGDLDVVLCQIAGPPLLLRNDQTLGHHWIRLKLVGTRSNRDAIGAWIQARVGDHTLSRQVMPTRSYLSQSELPVTIGLGDAPRVDSVEIEWPSGARQKIQPAIDRLTIITEPR